MLKRVTRRILLILGGLVALLAIFLLVSMIRYSPEYVLRVLRWRESSVATYRELFPARPVAAPDEPFRFAAAAEEADRVAVSLAAHLGVPDFDAFNEAAGTEAFIVIEDDRVLLERYYQGAGRDTLMTSFSVAKSFTTALIGAAIAEGAIGSVDDPITEYLPELAERDPRFAAITVRHLMMMASGLDYREFRPGFFNSDDILTTYYPDQREAALEFTRIDGPPGQAFHYNKYHPQLLGLILERATGVPVATYLERTIWRPLGMEFAGSWSLDSAESGFEKMETGVNAAAIDFARFGRLYLEGGSWEGVQVLPADWIAQSTRVDPPTYNAAYYADDFGQFLFRDLRGYYKYMWYGFVRGDDGYDFMAEGDLGQFVYVAPHRRLIIVRNGLAWGVPSGTWIRAFYAFAGEEP